MKQIFDFLMISGVLLGAIFVIAMQFTKNGRDKSVVYLNLVIVFLMLNNLQAFLLEVVFLEAPFFISRLQIPWYLMILPSFYTFLIHYLKIEDKLSSFFKLSMVIFCAELIIRILLIPDYYTRDKNLFIGQYVQIEEIINASFSIYLFVKSILVLFKYSTLYKPILLFDNLRWLKNFMFLGGIVMLMWICAILLNIDKALNPHVSIYYPLRFSSTCLLYWIVYQGFYNYSLMTERIQLREVIAAEEKKQNDIANVSVVEESKFQSIKTYIEKNKRFRDPTFSLEKLASEMDISTSKLSHVINQESGYNFSDYINFLRVEKARKYLMKSNYSNYTIVAIGLECGFNSKSAFYAAFKKFTSVTPSEFREKQMASS